MYFTLQLSNLTLEWPILIGSLEWLPVGLVVSKANILFASRLFISKSTGRHARIFGIGGAGYDTFFHGDNALLNPTYANLNLPFLILK